MAQDKAKFEAFLIESIGRAIKKAERRNMKLVVRLNGTSDIRWDKVIATYPSIQFYDYTKSASRTLMHQKINYHLTFSMSETNFDDSCRVLANGGNVATVFRKVPDSYNGVEVVNGDENDLRFLDKKNVVVGLLAKGRAKKDKSGFVK